MQLFNVFVVLALAAIAIRDAMPRIVRLSQFVTYGLSAVGAASVAHYINVTLGLS